MDFLHFLKYCRNIYSGNVLNILIYTMLQDIVMTKTLSFHRMTFFTHCKTPACQSHLRANNLTCWLESLTLSANSSYYLDSVLQSDVHFLQEQFLWSYLPWFSVQLWLFMNRLLWGLNLKICSYQPKSVITWPTPCHLIEISTETWL